MAKGKAGHGRAGHQPQCGALTADGKQCRNSSRGASNYCASHKGYQPPSGKGLAKRIEGKSWSARDKLSNKASARHADTRPRAAKASDTALATRKRGKKVAKAPKAGKPVKADAPRPTVRSLTRASTRPVRRDSRPAQDPAVGPGFVATLLQPERDYLVVYEEPDPDGVPTDDGLLLDIDAGQPVSLGEVDLEQKLDLELSNNTNWVGRLGFVVSILGAAIGFGACAIFAYAYPDPWYTTDGDLSATGYIPATVLVGVTGVLMMLAGVMLTHYGRRIQAKGNLSRMRIVEKAFQPRVALGDEYANQ